MKNTELCAPASPDLSHLRAFYRPETKGASLSLSDCSLEDVLSVLDLSEQDLEEMCRRCP